MPRLPERSRRCSGAVSPMGRQPISVANQRRQQHRSPSREHEPRAVVGWAGDGSGLREGGMNDALGCGVGTQVESQSRVHFMLKSFCLMSAIAVGTLLSLPLTASAMTLGPSAVIASSIGSNVQT